MSSGRGAAAPDTALDPVALRSAVDVLYDRVRGDADLARWFDRVDVRRLRAHQAQFLLAVLTPSSPGEREGLPAPLDQLTTAHRGLAVDDAAFDRVAEHLAVALTEVGMDHDTAALVLTRVSALRPLVVTRSGENLS